MKSSKPRVIVTLGDPGGIGPEVILKSLSLRSIRRLGTFQIVGNQALLQETRRRLRLRFSRRIPVVEAGSYSGPVRFGTLLADYGLLSVSYLKKAVALLKGGEADCLVTGPIHKEALRVAGFSWEGHTELLRDLTRSRWAEMTFVGRHLKLILATRHLPFRSVPEALNRSLIFGAIRRMDAMLRFYFKISHPRLAVCGLNPHAGEGGLFGKEETDKIAPAVKSARRLGIRVEGPLSPDSVFYHATHGSFDGIVALYHDQGLIPFKMIERDTGVNVTLGLPFIRTSPDHGTAFDIAGRGIADPSAMTAAIRLACQMWRVSRGRRRPDFS